MAGLLTSTCLMHEQGIWFLFGDNLIAMNSYTITFTLSKGAVQGNKQGVGSLGIRLGCARGYQLPEASTQSTSVWNRRPEHKQALQRSPGRPTSAGAVARRQQ